MSKRSFTLGALLNELADDHLIADPATHPLPAALAPAADQESSPWYVKALVGIAAWVAAILLGIFFSALGIFDTSTKMLIWGSGLLIAAVALRWGGRNSVFWGQLAFAVILAGQGLFLAGMADRWQDGSALALAVIVLELLLFLLYPDALHRMLSVLAICGALTFLIYDQELPQLVHALIFITAIGATLTWQHELRLLTSRVQAYRAPLGYGLTLALFGLCLLTLGGWYGATDWWLSAVALAFVLLYLVIQILRDLALPLNSHAGIWALGALLLLSIPAYQTPGILAALGALLLGRWRSNTLLLGLAAVFLLFFLGAYYYNLEITLLNKSYILMGSGGALLAAWWGVRRWSVDGGTVGE